MACVPSAWGHGGPRAGQLDAQSVEGVFCSVEGGRLDPQRRPDICSGLPSDRDVLLGRPSQGLTALHSPIHKTLGRKWKGGRKVRDTERREGMG